MYVEPLEDHRRAEMLMMLVDQTERNSLESHSFADGNIENPMKVNKIIY